MRLQRYVSDELAHFVGRRHLGHQEAQYDLLLKILTDGQLHPGGAEEYAGLEMWSAIGQSHLCDEDMFFPPVVCFCDIPPDDLGIHMAKYGQFGLAFTKEWLVARGANPVFYVAAGASPVAVGEGEAPVPRADHFNKSITALFEALYEFDDDPHAEAGSDDAPCVQLHDRVHHLAHFFLTYHVFSFMKCFDPALPENDERGFYMEREWRVLGSVEFDLDDVTRVVLPPAYARRFRSDMPHYAGQLSFA